jgi:hypothetical protein
MCYDHFPPGMNLIAYIQNFGCAIYSQPIGFTCFIYFFGQWHILCLIGSSEGNLILPPT